MSKTVYIETTIPSAYVSRREDAGSVYRRGITHEWWTRQSTSYELRCSQAVVAELQAGNFPGQQEAVDLIALLPLFDITDETLAVAELYVRHRLMPAPATGDALHLALASTHEVDYLLTWNVRHLANPNKVDHMTVINRRLGLLSPVIVSPEGLWTEDAR